MRSLSKQSKSPEGSSKISSSQGNKSYYGVQSKTSFEPKKFAEPRSAQKQSVTDMIRNLSKERRNNSGSLNRLYNQLDARARQALNLAFLSNIKSGHNHRSFHEAL